MKSDISVFPNPFLQSLMVELPSAVTGAVQLTISDTEGNPVKQMVLADGIHSQYLQLAEAKPGTYLLQLKHKKGVFQKQIIKDN